MIVVVLMEGCRLLVVVPHHLLLLLHHHLLLPLLKIKIKYNQCKFPPGQRHRVTPLRSHPARPIHLW
jgi:hypothetical protein